MVLDIRDLDRGEIQTDGFTLEAEDRPGSMHVHVDLPHRLDVAVDIVNLLKQEGFDSIIRRVDGHIAGVQRSNPDFKKTYEAHTPIDPRVTDAGGSIDTSTAELFAGFSATLVPERAALKEIMRIVVPFLLELHGRDGLHANVEAEQVLHSMNEDGRANVLSCEPTELEDLLRNDELFGIVPWESHRLEVHHGFRLPKTLADECGVSLAQLNAIKGLPVGGWFYTDVSGSDGDVERHFHSNAFYGPKKILRQAQGQRGLLREFLRNNRHDGKMLPETPHRYTMVERVLGVFKI